MTSWASEQGVADEDGGGVAPHGPHRRAVAPFGVAVHQVVVDQGEVVHELHRDRAAQRGRRVAGDGLAGQQGQRGAHRLAGVRVERPTTLVAPAEVVGRHQPAVVVEPVHGTAQRG